MGVVCSLAPPRWPAADRDRRAYEQSQRSCWRRRCRALATADPFLGFVRTIPYRFFPLSILAFLIAGALSGKDFGPMLDEENRAVTIGGGGGVAAMEAEAAEEAEAAAGELDPKPGTPLRAVNALLPFGVVMVTAFCGMVYQGQVAIAALPASQAVEPTLVNCLRFADSVAALIWGSAAGWLASLGCVLGQRLLSLGEAMEAWTAGTKEVLEPVFVLLLAWAWGAVIADVGTAEVVASAPQGAAGVSFALISVICFAISFACGSSFGTCGMSSRSSACSRQPSGGHGPPPAWRDLRRVDLQHLLADLGHVDPRCSPPAATSPA